MAFDKYTRSSYIVVPDEIDALREAVEVLETITEDSASEITWLRDYNSILRLIAVEYGDAFAAACEAVEVLEDMYEQRDAETEEWFQKWMAEYSDHHDTQADLKDADAMVDDYAARLKASNDDYIALQHTASYYSDRLDKVRERVKTYRITLSEIAAFGSNGGATLARHVLNSRIDDGGSDF